MQHVDDDGDPLGPPRPDHISPARRMAHRQVATFATAVALIRTLVWSVCFEEQVSEQCAVQRHLDVRLAVVLGAVEGGAVIPPATTPHSPPYNYSTSQCRIT